MRYFVDEEGGVEMARDGVWGKKSTDLVVYVINEATKLLKGTSVRLIKIYIILVTVRARSYKK